MYVEIAALLDIHFNSRRVSQLRWGHDGLEPTAVRVVQPHSEN
jgi:hypothetical protein